MSTKLSILDHLLMQEFTDYLLGLTRTYHRLTMVSDRLHGGHDISTGTRSLLLLLHMRGNLSLSEIARDRAVSRQFIQRVAGPLLEKAAIVLVANPRDKRSPKLALTDQGQAMVAGILTREAALSEAIAAVIARDDITAANRVMSQLDDCLGAFESTVQGMGRR